MAIIVDTSCLYALMAANDARHELVKSFVQSVDDVLVVPDVVLPEATYLINKFLGVEAEIALLTGVAAGEVALEPLAAADVERALEVLETYRDADIGFVDAAIVAVAERIGIKRILTLDQHFQMIKPKHADSFEVCP